VLSVGERIPDVTLAAQDGEPVGLLALAAAGAMLLAFYVFDWTGT
jgi:peroxiredoxin